MVTIVGGLVGGLVATIVMSIVMRAMGGGPPPTANLLAKFQGGEPEEHMMPGMLLHLVYGTIAGGILVVIVTAAALAVGSPTAWIVTGLVYGIILLMVGALGWVRGAIGMKPDRQTMIGFAVVHLVYGLVLGAWLGYGIIG